MRTASGYCMVTAQVIFHQKGGKTNLSPGSQVVVKQGRHVSCSSDPRHQYILEVTSTIHFRLNKTHIFVWRIFSGFLDCPLPPLNFVVLSSFSHLFLSFQGGDILLCLSEMKRPAIAPDISNLLS